MVQYNYSIKKNDFTAMKYDKKKLFSFLQIGSRILLGGIFIAASVDKILHPAEFAVIINGYKLVPDFLLYLVAIVLPWIEVILGLLLVAGVWLYGSLLLSNLLLWVFLGALLYNTSRGLHIGCGCFSTAPGQEVHTTWYIIRDSMFVLLGLVAAYSFWKKPSLR